MISLVLIAILVGFFVAAILVAAGHVIYDLWNQLKVEREIGKVLRAKIEEVSTYNKNVSQTNSHLATLLKQLTELYEGTLAAQREAGSRPFQISFEQTRQLVDLISAHLEKIKVN